MIYDRIRFEMHYLCEQGPTVYPSINYVFFVIDQSEISNFADDMYLSEQTQRMYQKIWNMELVNLVLV